MVHMTQVARFDMDNVVAGSIVLVIEDHCPISTQHSLKLELIHHLYKKTNYHLDHLLVGVAQGVDHILENCVPKECITFGQLKHAQIVPLLLKHLNHPEETKSIVIECGQYDHLLCNGCNMSGISVLIFVDSIFEQANAADFVFVAHTLNEEKRRQIYNKYFSDMYSSLEQFERIFHFYASENRFLVLDKRLGQVFWHSSPQEVHNFEIHTDAVEQVRSFGSRCAAEHVQEEPSVIEPNKPCVDNIDNSPLVPELYSISSYHEEQNKSKSKLPLSGKAKNNNREAKFNDRMSRGTKSLVTSNTKKNNIHVHVSKHWTNTNLHLHID